MNDLKGLGRKYWEERYSHHQTGWDIGSVSPALKEYFDQLSDKTINILIPGAGSAHEAAYLWENGFKKVTILDIARQPLIHFSQEYPKFPQVQLVQGDFFEYSITHDLVIEQAFFCAIDPSLRERYMMHMYEILKPGGKLVGLLWNHPMNSDQPPFGGSIEEYQRLFGEKFDIQILEEAKNSIKPRMGREEFFIFKRKG